MSCLEICVNFLYNILDLVSIQDRSKHLLLRPQEHDLGVSKSIAEGDYHMDLRIVSVLVLNRYSVTNFINVTFG
jgi:hypothetical protein